MDLITELRIEETKTFLYNVRKYTYNKFKRSSTATKSRVLAIIKQLESTRDLDTIDRLVKEIRDILHLTIIPTDGSWARKYKSFYGYEYVLKNGWAPLFDLVKTNGT